MTAPATRSRELIETPSAQMQRSRLRPRCRPVRSHSGMPDPLHGSPSSFTMRDLRRGLADSALSTRVQGTSSGLPVSRSSAQGAPFCLVGSSDGSGETSAARVFGEEIGDDLDRTRHSRPRGMRAGGRVWVSCRRSGKGRGVRLSARLVRARSRRPGPLPVPGRVPPVSRAAGRCGSSRSSRRGTAVRRSRR